MTAASDAAQGPRGGFDGGWNRDGDQGRGRGCGAGVGWRPIELVAMVLGFAVFWPIGLAIIAWKLWQKKQWSRGDFAAFAERKWRSATSGFRGARDERWRPFATGNMAFDDWKAAEMERLEQERRKLDEAQREFGEFLNNLRRARDREEFDRFRAEREARQGQSEQGSGPAT
jgi:hypothetical protein